MKPQLLSSLLATTATVAVGVFASPALAFDFVPQQEGEIDVGLGCYDDCIELDPIFESIISLTDSTTGSRSRLFVDKLSTTSEYNTGGSNPLKFLKKDAGTNWGSFFFRPSEYDESAGESEEEGQLEVGTFQFNFSKTLAQLDIDFFDTESWNSTGITAINGVAIGSPDWLAKGIDGNVQSQSFFDVSSVTIKFGNDTANGTGDGVNFKMNGEKGVPEPTTILGGLIASAGMAAARKRAKK